ncbi:hypothetical protein HDR64_00755 [bacterium]|nr:hypothetical protein [bacterium]
MKWNWRYGVACALGMIFIVSAIFKLISIDEFELYVFAFGLMGFDTATIAARCLIVGEALLGFCFMVNYRHRLVCWICAVVLGLFSGFLIWRLALGDTANCHCFGDVLDMSPGESLLKNILLGIGLGVTWRPFGTGTGIKFLYVLLVALVLCIGVFVYSLPDVMVRRHYKSEGIEKEYFKKTISEELYCEKGRKVFCLYGTSCQYCGRCAKKIEGVVARHALDDKDIVCVFMETSSDMAMSVNDFFREHTAGRVYAYQTVPVIDFLNMTKGVMPIVVLVEDGEVVGEYNYITLKESTLIDFLLGKSMERAW